MTGAFRLERPLDPDAPVGRPVRIRWEGRSVEAREGEPLAVALLAAGHDVLSRSLRFHRPRGLMCSSGACGWCDCRVDGQTGSRSCRVPVREGLTASGEHAWPSVELDLFAALDAVNRLVTPTFYHHRFLRPHALRKRYLDVIRAFGGRGRVRPGPRPARPRSDRAISADVLVVGAGLAGLTAALAALDAGASVAVLDAGGAAGGHATWSPDPAERARAGALAAAVAARATLVPEARVVTREGSRAVAVVPDGLLVVDSATVVAATGSLERPPSVPGADRPGTLAARMVEALLVRWGVAPGRRAAVVGEGPAADRVAALLASAGVQVAVVAAPGQVAAITGRARVTGIRVAGPGEPLRRHPVDHVAFTSRVPDADLARLAGAAVDWVDGVLCPRTGPSGETSVPWLFAVGSAAGADGAVAASLERAAVAGAAAGHAARGARAATPAEPAWAPGGDGPARIGGHAPGAGHPSALVCFCEDVRLRDLVREANAGYRDPELLKRRTGALTGYCQGKLCLDRFLGACERAAPPTDAVPVAPAGPALVAPTARPPLSPVRLGDLVEPTGEDAWTR